MRFALLWSIAVLGLPTLRSEDERLSSEGLGDDGLGFGRPAAQAVGPNASPPLGFSERDAAGTGFPTQPIGRVPSDLSSAMAPLPNKLEWEALHSGGTPPPAPYLIPMQAQGILPAVDPGLPIDPNADPAMAGLDYPAPFDEGFMSSEPNMGFDEQAEYDVPGAGDFTRSLGGTSGFTGYGRSWGGMPSGFLNQPGALPFDNGLGGTLLDGLGLSAFLSGTYDTNPSQGNGSSTGGGGGDFFLTLGGTAAYRSKASDWTYGLRYTGSYNQYFKQTRLSGYNQNAGASVNYQGGPLSAGLDVGLNFGSGANRYYEDVVKELSVNVGLSARYQFSRKTAFTGNLSQRFTSASGGSSSDTGAFNARVAALWRYSSLTEFGPGLSYSVDGGSTQQKLTSIGPTLTANYKLSTKVSINSLIGLEFSQYEDGQTSDPWVSASIGANYQASSLWGMNLSFDRNVSSDPGSDGQFNESTSLRLGYNRKIRRAALNLGVSLQNSSYHAPDTVVLVRPDSNYLNFDSSIGMPIFANSCNASVFARYSDQNSDSGSNSFDSFQAGFSLSRSF